VKDVTSLSCCFSTRLQITWLERDVLSIAESKGGVVWDQAYRKSILELVSSQKIESRNCIVAIFCPVLAESLLQVTAVSAWK
jgi:hypothetical protein